MPTRTAITIKRTDNAALVHHLHEKIFKMGADWETADAYWLALDRSREDSAEIGFAAAQYLPLSLETDYDQPAVFLHRVGVFPEYAGKGIQRRLILARERWAMRQGATLVVTYASRHNEPSIANLLRMGYRFAEPWIGYSAKEWVFFTKELEHV
jgi:GNAT superfamily N-acetyltransferase